MMDCDKFKMFFSNYLDGGLFSDTKKDLEEHLRHCPKCSETLYRVRIVRDSLRSLPTVTATPNFELRLNREISLINRKKRFEWSGFFQNWKVPAVGSAIVLAIVGFLLVVTLPENEPISPATQMSTQQITEPAMQPVPQNPVIGTQPVNVTQISQGAFIDSTSHDSSQVSRDGIRLIGDH